MMKVPTAAPIVTFDSILLKVRALAHTPEAKLENNIFL